ncbi:MAG: hypothetical protein HY077_17690 [Elusimicrobia bacterium]|nr:hypothetical protein [Elusimicrobiota bacterium]
MTKSLSALLALVLAGLPAANSFAASEGVKIVGPVRLETQIKPVDLGTLPASLVKPVSMPEGSLEASVPLPPALPDSFVKAAAANDANFVPAALNGPSANDDLKAAAPEAKTGELQAAEQSLKFDGAPMMRNPQWRSVALAIMAAGSFNLSRTNVVGRKWFAPEALSTHQVRVKAETNFRKAALLVVDHARELPLSRGTAVRLNKILTEGLVPEEIRGDPDYHTDTHVFYKWLESEEAKTLAGADPKEFAQQLHYKMSRLDSFPDGNGRLARLMADLSLIQNGYAPVYYSDMADYFARGNHRSKVSPEVRRNYFREMLEAGQRAIADPEAFKAGLRERALIDKDVVAAITADPGHLGKPAISRKIERANKAKPTSAGPGPSPK